MKTFLMAGAAWTALAGAAYAADPQVQPSPTGSPDPSAAVAEQPGASAPNSPGATTLDTVVVTARRRAENLQTVPVAVTAFSGREIAERQINNQVDLANNTPSLVAIATGFPKELGGFVIRGQGPAFNGTSGTLPYFAEAPDSPLPVDGRRGTFYDLANIQILKGPQGTLFGKNATGGVLLFEPQRPTDTFGGYVQGQFGNLNDRQGEGAINIPIVPGKVLLRIAGAAEQRDGYTKDVGPYFAGKRYDDVDYRSARVSLILRPTEWLENYTVFRYLQSNNNGPGTVPYYSDPTRVDINAFFPNRPQLFQQQQDRGVRDVSYNLDQSVRAYFSETVNTTTVKLPWDLTLKNIVSYTRNYDSYTYDYDASPLPLSGQTSTGFPTTETKYFTEELQLQGKALENRLQFVGGLFTDAGWNDRPSMLYAQAFPVTTVLGFDIPAYAKTSIRSRAAFVQGTYDFGGLSSRLEGLSVTAGYRYTHEYNSSYAVIFAPPATQGSGQFHYGSYTVDVDYKINKNTLVYATFRDAFKSGGVNAFLPTSSPFFSYVPEELADKEFGVKSDFSIFGMKARTDLDVFFGDYSNIQRTVPTVVTAGVLAQVVRTAAEGSVNGVEFEGRLIPLRGLEFDVNYAYTDSNYGDVDPTATALLAGAQFPYTPANKYSLAVRYSLPWLHRYGDLTASGIYTHQSSSSIAQSNQTVFPTFPGFGVLNLRLDMDHIMGTPLGASLFLANALDKTYVVGQFDSVLGGNGFVTRTYGEPQTFGIQLRYAFGGR